MMNRKHKLSSKQINAILRDYPNTSSMDLAARYQVPCHVIYRIANTNGVHKSEQFLQDVKKSGRFDKLSEGGKPFRFPKGHVPVNKGKGMSEEQRRKSEHTFFKKGQKPKNTVHEENAIRERKDKRGVRQLYIKISDGNWQYLKRYVYEQHHGVKLTSKDVIRFKDGNPLNCDISNLELITKKDNMLKNSIQNYPEEIKTTIRLIHKLNKKISTKNGNKEQN